MITGEELKTTGIVRQHLGDAELHREVGDAIGHGNAVALLLLIPERTAQIVVEISRQGIKPVQEATVERQLVEPGRAHRAQQGNWILAALGPQSRLDRLEQILSWLVPRPSQVGGQLFERRQAFRKVGTDREPTEGFHASLPY